MDQEKIGKFIKRLRKEKGLTQEQLGEKLGVNSKAVSKWECGLTMPDVSILNELADILGITTRELLEGKEKLTKKRMKDIIKNINKIIINHKIIAFFVSLFVIAFVLLFLFFYNNYNKFEVISFRVNENSIKKEDVFAEGYIYITPNGDYVSLNKLLYTPEGNGKIKDLTIKIENDKSVILFYKRGEMMDDYGNKKTFYLMDFLNTFSYVTSSGKKETRFNPNNLKLILSYTPEKGNKSITKEFDLIFRTDSSSVKLLKY